MSVTTQKSGKLFQLSGAIIRGLPVILFAALFINQAVFAEISPLSISGRAHQTQYSLGSPVSIRVSLRNVSTSPIKLSPLADGNIRVLSFRRDGNTVPMRTGTLKLDEPLAFALHRSLRAVEPGRSLEMEWTSVLDDSLGGQAFQVVDARSDPSEFTSYSIAEPGNYEVTWIYQYGGQINADPSIFREPSGKVTVRFRVDR